MQFPMQFCPTGDHCLNVGILGNETREVKFCPYVFYEMAINSDGTYSMFRFDWKGSLLLGNELGLNKSPKKV
jgi:hypothetical protein